MIEEHAFGVIRVTFKRANAKTPIIDIPALGYRPPKFYPTLSVIEEVYRKAAVTGTVLLSSPFRPRPMYAEM